MVNGQRRGLYSHFFHDPVSGHDFEVRLRVAPTLALDEYYQSSEMEASVERTPLEDAAVEKYLNELSAYYNDKQRASKLWGQAFIELAAARASVAPGESVTWRDHSAKFPPLLRIGDLQVVVSGSQNSSGIASEWPSQHLQAAIKYFGQAVRAEVATAKKPVYVGETSC